MIWLVVLRRPYSLNCVKLRFNTRRFGYFRVLLKTEKDFSTEKDRKELSDTEKDLDMACYAIKTYVKLYIRMEYILLSIILRAVTEKGFFCA